MGILTPQTVKSIAREMYGYQLSDEAARALAYGTGALMTISYHLSGSLEPGSVELAFSYDNLATEAARIQKPTRR